jgi:hypothetical protein
MGTLLTWLKTQFRKIITDYDRGYNDALLDVMNKIKDKHDD